jgi:glucose-6-phosphate isomerase
MALSNVNPLSTSSWKSLLSSAERLNSKHISELLNEDSERFQKYSFSLEDILFDFSKNKIDAQIVRRFKVSCTRSRAIRSYKSYV